MNLLDKDNKPLSLYKEPTLFTVKGHELITYYRLIFTADKYNVRSVNGVIEVTRKASGERQGYEQLPEKC